MNATHYLLLSLAAGLSMAGAVAWWRARKALRAAQREAALRIIEENNRRWVQRRAADRKTAMAEIVKLRPDERDLAEDFRNRRKVLAHANPPTQRNDSDDPLVHHAPHFALRDMGWDGGWTPGTVCTSASNESSYSCDSSSSDSGGSCD